MHILWLASFEKKKSFSVCTGNFMIANLSQIKTVTSNVWDCSEWKGIRLKCTFYALHILFAISFYLARPYEYLKCVFRQRNTFRSFFHIQYRFVLFYVFHILCHKRNYLLYLCNAFNMPVSQYDFQHHIPCSSIIFQEKATFLSKLSLEKLRR